MSQALPAARTTHILGAEIARIPHPTLAATVAEQPCCIACGSTNIRFSEIEDRDDDVGYHSMETLVTCHYCGARETEHDTTMLVLEVAA